MCTYINAFCLGAELLLSMYPLLFSRLLQRAALFSLSLGYTFLSPEAHAPWLLCIPVMSDSRKPSPFPGNFIRSKCSPRLLIDLGRNNIGNTSLILLNGKI